MGREVRKVPPNWEHPKDERGHEQPMFDQTFAEAAQEWKDAFAAWERGERPSYCSQESRNLEHWEYHGGPPDRAYYRPWSDEEATWFQLWQTVSEGSPVSPPFETKEELASYLAEYGDFWDQMRGHGGWGMERARAFVEAGWAPSMAIVNGEILESKDIPLRSA
jgi:hypothetical protein